MLASRRYPPRPAAYQERECERLCIEGYLSYLGRGLAHRLRERATPVSSDDLDVLGPMVLRIARPGRSRRLLGGSGVLGSAVDREGRLWGSARERFAWGRLDSDTGIAARAGGCGQGGSHR